MWYFEFPGGLPPGTPIAIGSLPQSQQNGSTAQQVFRLPTQGQVISVPGMYYDQINSFI